MLHVKTDVETAEKTKLFRFEIRNFLLVGAEIIVDFFASVIGFPLKSKHLERDMVSNDLSIQKGSVWTKSFICFAPFRF